MKTLKTLSVLFLMSFLLVFNLSIAINGAQAGSGFLELENQEGFKDGEIAQEYGQSSDEPRDIRMVIVSLIRTFLGLLGIVFVGLLVYAGFKYMTSQGNDDQVAEARKQIVHSVIGLVIILTAYSITHFILVNVLKATKKGLFE